MNIHTGMWRETPGVGLYRFRTEYFSQCNESMQGYGDVVSAKPLYTFTTLRNKLFKLIQ